MAFFDDLLSVFGFGDDEPDPQVEAARRAARAAQDEALREQQLAKRRAEYAALPALDKPSTIAAGEEQLRKLLKASGMNFSGGIFGGGGFMDSLRGT